MKIKVFDAENVYSLENAIQLWLDGNPGIKIEKVTQSTAAFSDSDGNYAVTTVCIFYSV